MITQLAQCRHDGIKSITELKLSPGWASLCGETKQTIRKGPPWRLQRLAGHDVPFFYPHEKSQQYIVLNPAISECFRRFYYLVVSIARSHWLQKIREIPANQRAIGGQGDIAGFLFGTARSALTQVRPQLLELRTTFTPR